MDNFDEKVGEILRHIKRVEDNCNIIARKLQTTGDAYDRILSLKMVRLGRLHDVSKFDTFEFDHLHKDSPQFSTALMVHRQSNAHHPEFWDSIHQMREESVAEMVADCVARGQEFGTDTRKWFREQATVKYRFDYDNDAVGKLIEKYLNLLLTPPFKETSNAQN